VPSAEQADNRRRGRVEDRIRQIAQDRLGLLTFTVSNKALDSLACKPGGNHHLRTRQGTSKVVAELLTEGARKRLQPRQRTAPVAPRRRSGHRARARSSSGGP
jgi:hypothetical protein